MRFRVPSLPVLPSGTWAIPPGFSIPSYSNLSGNRAVRLRSSKTLFNSYYNGVGTPHLRNQRGLLSRPALEEVLEWRMNTDSAVQALLSDADCPKALLARIELGMQHEMQHQELLFTDLLFSFLQNPLLPGYSETLPPAPAPVSEVEWHQLDEQLVEIGHAGDGFAFDNELPRHRQFIESFRIADRLVTNREYQVFYRRWGLSAQRTLAVRWLGHGTARRLGFAPALAGWPPGIHPPRGHRPTSLMHQSVASVALKPTHLPAGLARDFPQRRNGNWRLQSVDAQAPGAGLYPHQATPGWFGSVWQWTQSAYLPYPGFCPAEGAIGEYNGKFMSGQWVLRGSSFATPEQQQRRSYRNFFYPQDRWQFAGLRLAKSESVP